MSSNLPEPYLYVECHKDKLQEHLAFRAGQGYRVQTIQWQGALVHILFVRGL